MQGNKPSPFDSLHARLLGTRGSDGGFPYCPGGPGATESTIWGTLAWHLLDPESTRPPERQNAWKFLASRLRPDGSISINTGDSSQGVWLTAPLAILAFHAGKKAILERAIDFLLKFKSRALPLNEIVKQNNTLVGWPWAPDTFGWVEPTAWALIALRLAGKAEDPRSAEGRKLLLDRRLPQGGWNYGNKVVFSSELLPFIDTTALGILALFGEIPDAKLVTSVDHVEKTLPEIDSPYGLAMGLLALKLFGRTAAVAKSSEKLQNLLLSCPDDVLNVAHFALGLISLQKVNPFVP